MTRSQFRTENPQILGTTVQKLLARVTRAPKICAALFPVYSDHQSVYIPADMCSPVPCIFPSPVCLYSCRFTQLLLCKNVRIRNLLLWALQLILAKRALTFVMSVRLSHVAAWPPLEGFLLTLVLGTCKKICLVDYV
jgi:hypothetical protein